MNIEELLNIINSIESSKEMMKESKSEISRLLEIKENSFHPLVYINGDPIIGENVYIGLYSEINAKGGVIKIGNKCDIASFVSINVADSHNLTLGISKEIKRSTIIIEENVFIGSHCFIGGNLKIGHHSVIGAGTILINAGDIPPYSLIVGNPPVIKKGYYKDEKY